MSTSRAGRASRRLSSGTRLCPPASTLRVLGERRDGLLERAHGDVLERRRLHCGLARPAAAAPRRAPARGRSVAPRGIAARGLRVRRSRRAGAWITTASSVVTVAVTAPSARAVEAERRRVGVVVDLFERAVP